MNVLRAAAAVAAGGALGSALRFFVSTWFVERFGSGFPWGTFVINVTGSFAIGAILQIALKRSDFSAYLRLFLTTGILGGYTTFSTYAFETYALGAQGLPLRGTAYALGSVVAGVTAAYAGVLVARLVP